MYPKNVHSRVELDFQLCKDDSSQSWNSQKLNTWIATLCVKHLASPQFPKGDETQRHEDSKARRKVRSDTLCVLESLRVCFIFLNSLTQLQIGGAEKWLRKISFLKKAPDKKWREHHLDFAHFLNTFWQQSWTCIQKNVQSRDIARTNVWRTGIVYGRLRVHIFFVLFYAHLG